MVLFNTEVVNTIKAEENTILRSSSVNFIDTNGLKRTSKNKLM